MPLKTGKTSPWFRAIRDSSNGSDPGFVKDFVKSAYRYIPGVLLNHAVNPKLDELIGGESFCGTGRLQLLDH